ncbi:MAG TPA: hypothetical protein VIN59_04425, partial [Alphaproteobacteria bacterium]
MRDLDICQQKLTEVFENAGKLPFGCVIKTSRLFDALFFYRGGPQEPKPILIGDGRSLVKAFEDAGVPIMRINSQARTNQNVTSEPRTYRRPFLVFHGYEHVANDMQVQIALIAPTPHFMAAKSPLLTRTLH